MRSKKLNIFTRFIVGLLLIPQVQYAQTQDSLKFSSPLTLEECVQYGLENNQNLRSVRLQESIAETQVGETRAMGLPQVNFQGGINYNYEVRKSFLPETFANPQGDPDNTIPLPFGVKYDGSATFSASQLIFDGSYFVGLQAAKTLRELRKKESNQSEIETVSSITTAYYLVLINAERTKLVDANIRQLEEILSDTKAIFENGFAENIDVDRIQVNLNNLYTEKNKVERGLNYAKNLLKFQMGYDVNSPIELAGSLENISFEMNDYMKDENGFNYDQRPSYNILTVNEQLANLDLKNNKATHLPKLYANWSYGWNTGTNNTSQLFDFNERWLNYGVLGASIQWNIFAGLRRTNLMERNRIQIDQIQLQKSYLKNSIDLEISQNKADLKSASESLEIQKSNMELAEKVYKQTQIKYNEGVGSSLELLEAETSKKTAETNYYGALYDAIIAKINLEKALGILY